MQAYPDRFIKGGEVLSSIPSGDDAVILDILTRIAKETIESNKILGAICIAPAILARAGVLQGKKATVWNSPLDKSAVKILKENGAVFDNKPVIIDEKIIDLSLWKTSKGKTTKSDYATLQTWLRKDEKLGTTATTKKVVKEFGSAY